jgi:hypothetical protein
MDNRKHHRSGKLPIPLFTMALLLGKSGMGVQRRFAYVLYIHSSILIAES